jgi:hypothetical protein
MPPHKDFLSLDKPLLIGYHSTRLRSSRPRSVSRYLRSRQGRPLWPPWGNLDVPSH